jgi:hypothetical protein
VWDDEVAFIHDEVAIQDQVEIESARGTRVRSFTAKPSFDVEERVEEVAGGQAGEARRSGIQKARLIADTNGIGFVKSGYAELPQVLVEGGDGFTQQTLPVTQVAAESDRDGDCRQSCLPEA